MYSKVQAAPIQCCKCSFLFDAICSCRIDHTAANTKLHTTYPKGRVYIALQEP